MVIDKIVKKSKCSDEEVIERIVSELGRISAEIDFILQRMNELERKIDEIREFVSSRECSEP